MAAAGVMLLATGCSTPTTQKPVVTKTDDLQFTKEITATVTADQAIVMDGKKFKVADIPAQLAKRNASQYITILVSAESKMTRETLVDLIQALIKSNYFVVIDDSSKYADVPIPKRS